MLAITCALLIATVTARRGADPILQPAAYHSPDGHWILDVDPSRRDGGKSGTYSMHKDGQLVWEGERPWTLWEAVVTDSGYVGGYAYTEGIGSAKGDLRLLVLTPHGDPRVEERIPREGAHHIDGAPIPIGTGIVDLQDAARLIFQIYDENKAGELWVGYQLPDGHEAFRKRPTAQLANGDANIYRPVARYVPGAPLFLMQWERFTAQSNRTGAYYALFDADANPVWQLARPDDWEVRGMKQDYSDLMSIMRNGLGLLEESEPLHFALWAPASHERLEFAVESAGPSGWKVIDLGRRHQDDPINVAPASDVELPALALEERNLIQLDTSADAKAGTPVLQSVSVATIDTLGRALLQDGKSDVVFAFDSSGKRLFVGVPATKDIGTANLLDRIGATRGGGAIVPRSASELHEFGPHGEALGVRGKFPRDLSVDPNSGVAAGTRYEDGWELYDADWKLVKHVERRPDRRWLQNLSQPGWGPDGTLGLVEHFTRPTHGSFGHDLLLYAADGEIKKIISLPDHADVHFVVLSRSRAVLFSWKPQCSIVDLQSGECRRFKIAGAKEDAQWTWGFSADGTELLALDPNRELLHHYAIP